jgi:hypothetical protein
MLGVGVQGVGEEEEERSLTKDLKRQANSLAHRV